MEWQPIETAPKDGYDILLFVPGWRDSGFMAFWDKRSEHWIDCSDQEPVSPALAPTHWMRLPEPPEPTP